MKLNRNVAMAAMSLALIGAGSGVAMAADGGNSSPATHSQVSTQADNGNEAKGSQVEGNEGPNDQAAQDAACAAAGIDPTASNINFDDATGDCSLDNGADNGGNE